MDADVGAVFELSPFEVQNGSYGSYRAELDAGGPLTDSGSITYRLVGSYGDWESFVDYYKRSQSV